MKLHVATEAGERLPDWRERRRYERFPMESIAGMVLKGEHLRLEPLTHDHSEGLSDVGLDPELWRWTPARVRTREEMCRYIEAALDEASRGESLPFAIIEPGAGVPVGSTRYRAIEPAHRRLEIGSTWIARAWQRTAVNTEAKYLLLRQAFEGMGCVRVEFRADSLNVRSRRAITRIGAVQEGVLRRHILTWSGRWRDTVCYSILDHEWGGVKLRLAEMLGKAAPPAEATL